ncbi:MAG: hypothetical protein V1836_03675 [Candidatus Aenigmatarchaeota archaeon]
MDSRKGLGQDTIFLMVGILILLITALVIYALIGGPYCDDLAKKTASNIKVAVDTVATTGTYTKDSPYTTYAMLCQNNVKKPLTLNPADYRTFSAPEYMIYWEHFPESPKNIAEGLYKFDESYPFSKNMAMILGTNVALSFVSGTLSSFAKTAKGATLIKDISSKISKSTAGKVVGLFFKPFVIGGKIATLPLKLIDYAATMAAKGIVKPIGFIVKVAITKTGVGETAIGKWIVAKTAPNIFGRVVGLGFLESMGESALIQITEASEGKTVRMIRIVDPADSSKMIEKAIVPEITRVEFKTTIDSLASSGAEEDRIIAERFREFFAYDNDEIASAENFEKSFQELVKDSEKFDSGFYDLVGGAMKAARESFDNTAKDMASRYGLYAHRPITVFFDQSGLTRFSNKVNAIGTFRKMKFFGEDGKLVDEVSTSIKKSFSDLKITTKMETEDDFAAATEKFFVKDGKMIVASAETDTAMLSFLESEIKYGVDGSETGITKGAYSNLMNGAASEDDIGSIASSFHTNYISELRSVGMSEDAINAAEGKLSTSQYSKTLVRDMGRELKSAKEFAVDNDEALEIAMLSASWKREPEQLALMAQDEYETILWEGKGTIKFIKTNIAAFMVGTETENELKYAYLKAPNAGCESNTVCLNQKGVEQKKVDVKESDIKNYETAYVVSKDVMVRLERPKDGHIISPIGAGIGAFKLTVDPRFHLVSPCLAELKFYESGTDAEMGKPLIMSEVDRCDLSSRNSNYCYFDEDKFNEMAVGFYSSLACSVVADIGKLALFGFVLQPACSLAEVKTEYDTTWPFQPFEPLKRENMNIFSCNVEKNPKAAAKLAVTACCNIAKCDSGYVCSDVEYSDKNKVICGKDKCTLADLAKTAEEEYKTTCGCS